MKNLGVLTRSLISLAVVGLLLSGCGGAEQREAKHFAKAEQFFEEENYEKAALEAKNVLQINPKNADARYMMALLEEKKQNWRKVFGNLNAVIEIDPQHTKAQNRLGQIYLMSKQTDKALEKADLVLSIDANNVDALVLKAAVHIREQNFEDGKRLAQQALSIQPGMPQAISILARLKLEDNDVDGALALIEEGIEKNPDDIGLGLIKIQQNARLGRLSVAEDTFLQMIQRHPAKVNLRSSLAKFYVSTKQLDKAQDQLQRIIEVVDDEQKSDAKLNLVKFLAANRSTDTAVSAIQEFLKNDPQNFTLRFGLAELYLNEQSLAEARQVFEDIVKDDGLGTNGQKAQNQLALLAIREGEIASAQSLVDEVLSEDTRNSDALLIRGGLSLEGEKVDEAIADFRTILHDDPNSEKALVLLSSAHIKEGKLDLAKESLRKALIVNPKNLKARRDLVRLSLRSRDLEAAEKLLEDGIKLHPQDVGLKSMLVDLYTNRKDWASAERLARDVLKDPQFQAAGHFALGRVYQGQREFAKAVAEYEAAIDAKPKAIGPILTDLVKSYLGMKQPEKASARLRQVSKQYPQHVGVVNLLGEVYLYQGNVDAAAAQFEKAIQMQPKFVAAYRNLAGIELAQKDATGAIAIYRRGLDALPDYPQFHFALAAIYERTGQFDEAIGAYRQLLNINPNNLLAANNLAALIADHKSDAESLAEAVKLAAQFKDSNQGAFLDTYGWVSALNGEVKEAKKALLKAVSLAPNVAIFHYHLGSVYHQEGDAENARRELEKALADDKARFVGRDKAEALLAQLKNS